MKRRLLGVTAAVLGTVLISGAGLYTATTVAAAPVPTSVTLPLFGAPLTFDITTGPGGAISDVSVDPATGATATKARPHKVVFESANPLDATDTARIVIKSGHGGQKVSVKAGSLANVTGPGVWSGEVFAGVTGTVNFMVGAAAAGGPDITGVVATSTAGTAVAGAVEYSSGDDHEGDDDDSEQSARVKIKFTSATGDQSRTLSIKVKVETESDDDDDNGTEVKLSISLGKIRGVAIDAAAAAGDHKWTGLLCDGSTGTLNYTVLADGTVSAASADPVSAVVTIDGGKVSATFSDHERVSVRVKLEDGMIKFSVKERIRCDSPRPTVNGVATIAPPDLDRGDHHESGDDHGKGHGGGNNGGD